MIIFKVLHHLFRDKDRKEVLEMVKTTEPFMLNRWISFHMATLWNVSRKVNKYMFRVPKEILHGMITYLTPVQSVTPELNYISKPPKFTDNIPEELLQLKKYYNWSNRELEINSEVI